MKTKLTLTALFWGFIALSSFSQEIEWKAKAELPNQIHSGSAVTCLDKIYFIGGRVQDGSSNYYSNLIFEYNLEMDEWIKKPNMPTARQNLAVTTVEDKIYAIGGDWLRDKNEMYDPTTETWQTLAPMPTPRQHIKAAVVDNKIYIIGGLDEYTQTYQHISTKNEVYDPQTNTWEEKAPIPTPKHNYSTVVYNDKIYIFGGATQIGTNSWSHTSTVEVYDPATDTWDTSSSLPTIRFNPGIGLINDKIIVTGGYSGGIVITSVDVFNPVTEQWSQGNPLPKKNVAMGSTTSNNKIYIIGGSAGGSWIGYNTVYEGTLLPANSIPIVNYPLANDSCMANELYNWVLPDSTFIDDDTLSYSASIVGGDDLPVWLSFKNDSLSGTPSKTDTLTIVITATDNYNESVSDSFKLFIKPDLTGIREQSNMDDLIIFPNPATNYVLVQAKNESCKLETYQIIALNGKVIKEGKLDSERINISDLNKGTYLLTIKTDKRIIINKFIIN